MVEEGGSNKNSRSGDDESRRTRRSTTYTPSRMQQNNMEPNVPRPSTIRRESFLLQFAKTKGPPQIAFLMMLVAIGAGSTIGVSHNCWNESCIRGMRKKEFWIGCLPLSILDVYIFSLTLYLTCYFIGRSRCHDGSICPHEPRLRWQRQLQRHTGRFTQTRILFAGLGRCPNGRGDF